MKCFALGLNVGEPSEFQLFYHHKPTGGTTPLSWKMKHKVWLTTGTQPPSSSSGSKYKPGGHAPSSWRWRRLAELSRDATERGAGPTDPEKRLISYWSTQLFVRPWLSGTHGGFFSVPLFACVSQRWVDTSRVFWSCPTPITPNLCVYRGEGSVCFDFFVLLQRAGTRIS